MNEKLRDAIEQMKRGEEEGFNAVYSETYNRVYFHAKQIMKSEEDAKDLVQIVFIEAYRNIGTLQSSEAVYKWLDGITYRQGMKIFRKKRDVLLSEEAEGVFDAIESNDVSTMPELTADQKATGMIVKEIIEELPEVQKITVIGYYFDGLKVEQIADLMECSVNTVKSRLNYARKYIKDRVEEKEKKEGYRLHVFGLPVFWFAIRTLSDETKLTVQEAQNIYDKSCDKVGLQPGKISETTADTSSMSQKADGTEMKGAVSQKKTAGIAARFASLGKTAKVLIVAVAAAGVVATGGGITYALLRGNDTVESQDKEQQSAEENTSVDNQSDLKNDDSLKATDENKTEQTETQETEEMENFELTEKAGRQISAFVAAAYQCNYASVNSGEGWTVFQMNSDECLSFVADYISMVQMNMSGETPDPADLPYNWYEGEVTTQEVHDFCKDGLGIEIPSDYSYAIEREWGSLKIVGSTLESTFDARQMQVTGGETKIVSDEDGTITLSGNCTWYDPEKTEFQFTVTAVRSSNSEVFGGLTITGCEITEEDAGGDGSQAADYQLMAEKYYEIAQNTANSYNNMPAEYYLNDIDKDHVPELIVLEGAYSASYVYAVYQFNGTDAVKVGEMPYGSLYGDPENTMLYSQYFQMDYEVDFGFDMKEYSILFQGDNPMQDDGYVGVYQFPAGSYQLTSYTADSVETVYNTILFLTR